MEPARPRGQARIPHGPGFRSRSDGDDVAVDHGPPASAVYPIKKISTRFALLMAAAAVLPLLAYGAVSIVSLRTGAQQAVILGNQNVAKQVAEQIDLYVTGSVRILKALAADLQQTGLERWQQDRILKNFVLQFAEFQELTVLDDS